MTEAAELTGYAARPLLLFYALSQAGQALEATAGRKPPQSHGLVLKTSSDSVLQAYVEPEARGRFQSVSESVASPRLTASAQLGALMASIPELAPFIPASNDDWPHPIEIQQMEVEGAGAYVRDKNWAHFSLVFRQKIDSADAMANVLALYPEIKGRWTNPYSGRDFLPLIWHGPDGSSHVSSVLLNDGGGGPSGIVPSYRGMFVLRPAIVPDEPPPSPLMTWWLISYALSMYARYYPRQWVKALDINASREAILLERCMEEAPVVFPELIVRAIPDVARAND